ncbi:hypothetical protein BGZ96_012273 [Linnemannia gamsii]|uniref:ER transporter 6TM N-terminal domain-containing protein n=1 Tax=Linnemannia gamsii TaxID=64522 RepID=A0ABQ7JQQ6_9FUNG|nr:hypothetical protein BGZ96_012273 [Linnemannia gamsii]
MRSYSISTESMDSKNSVPFAPPAPPTLSLWRKFKNQLPNRVLKRHLRLMAALYLAALMTLIRPVANFLGATPFLAIITVSFMHPARTVGSQLEVTLFSVIGAIIATAWIIPCQLSVAAYNRQFFEEHETLDGNVSWTIEAAWFFVGIWIMTSMNAWYAKLTYTFLIFTIANIYAYNKIDNDNLTFNIHAYWGTIGPMMIGVGISLLTNLVLWPETASEGLGRALNESLDTSRALLDLSTRSFLLHHNTIVLPKSIIENAQAEVRKAQKKLFTAYREARYEVTFATNDPADYEEVCVVVSTLMQHLGSMSLVVQNERLLMLGHPDRENDDLETESGDDQNSTSDGGSSSDEDDCVDERGMDTGRSLDIGSTSGEFAVSGGMTGGDYDGAGPKKHKRGSAAELRRIRQLLMRAEKSTATVVQAHKAQGDGEGLKREERSKRLEYNVPGSATAPSIPEGRGSRVGDGQSVSSFERISGSRLSTGNGESGQLPITATIIRTSGSSPHLGGAQGSRQPGSLDGDHVDRSLKGSKDLLGGKSTTSFKSSRSPPHQKSNHGKENRRQKRTRSGSIDGTGSSAGAGKSLRTGSLQLLSGAEGLGTDEDNGAGVSSSIGDFPEKLQSRHSISGSMSEYQVNKAAEAFAAKKMKERKRARKQAEHEAKAEQKRLRRQERGADAAKNVPPKEVVFGNRKMFLSFLDTVREPLQRLSDACSRSMVTMERELVKELNVEKDRMERIKKRKADRDAIVRQVTAAKGNPWSLKKEELPKVSDPHPSTQDVNNGSAINGPPPSRWQQIGTKIGVLSPLTQGEMDLMNVVRNATNKETRPGVSNSGVPVDGAHTRKLRQGTVAALSGDAIDENEGDTTIPGDMSYVQYLTQELEIFDQVETDGLREFIASHPALDVGPREEIFLIFFFIFALREIARELLRLGKHLEEMKRKQEVQMALDGRKKPRGRLWWPKVTGNFERWFSWGGYAQTRSSEGFSGMVMGSAKNLERQQPRLFAEVKAHLAAKAAKAAEQEAKQVSAENAGREELERRNQLGRRPNSEAWDTPRLRRSVTISTVFPRSSGQTGDLEAGGGDSTRFAPQTGMSDPRTSRITGPRTVLVSNSRTGDRSTRMLQADVPVHPLSGDGALEVLGSQSGSIAGRDGPSQQGPYTVVYIPDFQSLHPRTPTDNSPRDTHLTSALSPMVNTIQPHLSAPPEVNLLNETLQPTTFPGAAETSSSSRNQATEPHPSFRHQSSHLPHLQVTHTDQSDDGDDREEAVMGYEGQSSRKRTQSAYAEFSLRHSKEDSSQDEKYQEKQRRHRPSTPPPPSPQPAFVNVPKPKPLRFRIWEFLQELKSDEVRYGLKMSSALTFVGLWSWLGWTDRLLAEKGQWVMMTIIAVLSPTIGATFSASAWRICGTLVGILWGMLTYLAYPNNPYVILAMMSVITFLVAYCILISANPSMGVIMMLSYNAIVFGIYHGQTQDGIFVTCYQMAITMIIGVLIAVVLNTFLWPVLARRELRKEVSLLIGSQGVLFAELVNRYLLEEPTSREWQPLVQQDYINEKKAGIHANQSSEDQESNKRGEEDEGNSDMDNRDRASMGSKLVMGSGRSATRRYAADPSRQQDERNHRSQEGLPDEDGHQEEYHLDTDQLAFQHVEHQLQEKMIQICQLLDLSASEPRLKEKFPRNLYKQIVECCQNILDRMVSMRMAAQLLSPEVRDLVTGPMNYYRRDMVGALLLYFSVLSSSLASRTPLPPYLPSARMARLRVIYNVKQAIAAHQAKTGEDHYTYIYYYAFSSALEEVIEELELLAILIKPLVGVTLVGSSEGYPSGVAADQLDLESAISPMHMPVPPLQPRVTGILADEELDLHLGLSPEGITTTSRNTGVTNSVASPQQHQRAGGPGGTRILTKPSEFSNTYSMSSPVVTMDQTLLENRHTQRFKEAIETANEVSSLESTSVPAASTTTPGSRQTSFKKKLSERIKDSPLIKEVFSSRGHHQRPVDDSNMPGSSSQIVPQQSSLAVESKEITIDPTAEEKEVAASPQHGLGLALEDTSTGYSVDMPPLPVNPPSNGEGHSLDPK